MTLHRRLQLLTAVSILIVSGPVMAEPDIDLVALDDGLKKLAELDPKLAQVVELRWAAT